MNIPVDPSREMTMSRVYRAPRALVLKMWSDPAHLTNWWGPFGFTTTTDELNFTPGGAWKFTMHGPDGMDYRNFIRYIEISSEQLVYDHGSDETSIDFRVIVSLVETEPGKTNMEIRGIFPSAEAPSKLIPRVRRRNDTYQKLYVGG